MRVEDSSMQWPGLKTWEGKELWNCSEEQNMPVLSVALLGSGLQHMGHQLAQLFLGGDWLGLLGQCAAMAPKSKGSGKKKVDNRKRPQLADTTGHMNRVLLENPEHLNAHQRRRLNGRRQDEEKIERQLQSHFSFLTKAQLASIRVQGQSLRERVQQDWAKLSRQGAQRLGSQYWTSLAAEFGEHAGMFKSMSEDFQHLQVDMALLQYLDQAVCADTKARTTEPVVNYLGTSPPLNGRNLVGYAKTVEASANISRLNADLLWMALGHHLARCGLAECPEGFMAILCPVLDSSLCRDFQRCRKGGVGLQAYIASKGPLLNLIFGGDHLQQIMLCDGHWDQVQHHLKAVTSKTCLGSLMFDHALKVLTVEGLQKTLHQLIDDTFEVEGLTVEGLQAFMSMAAEELAPWKECQAVQCKRSVSLPFLGSSVPIVVMTPHMELNYRVWGKLKDHTIGVDNGGLPMLLQEEWCKDKAWYTQKLQKLPCKELLQPLLATRTMARDILKPQLISCLADLKTLMVANSEVLQGMDSTWGLEVAWAEHCMDQSVVRAVEMAVLQCLPSQTRAVEPTDAFKDLERFRGGKLLQCADRGSQDKVKAVMEVVAALKDKVPVDLPFEHNSSDFFGLAGQRLQNFVRSSKVVQHKEAEDAEPHEVVEELVGSEALKQKLGEVQAIFAKQPQTLKFHMLDCLVTYRWLLTEAEHKQVQTLVQACIQHSGGGPQAHMSGKAVPKAKPDAKKKDAPSSLMKYF